MGSTGVTTAGVLLITGDLALAGVIGIIDTLVKTGLFYLHEHCWARTDWGRPKKELLDNKKIERDLRRQKQEAVDGCSGGGD